MSKLKVDEIRSADRSVSDSANIALADDGKVGIGTTAPTGLLSVRGSADNAEFQALSLTNSDWASGETGQSVAIQFSILRTGTTDAAAGKIVAGKDDDYDTTAEVDSHLAFYTTISDAQTERMRITSAGNVGIGTSAPPVGLSVQGGTGDKATIQIKQTATGGVDYRITSRDDGSLRFNDDTSGAERMRINSAGNVVIGQSGNEAIFDYASRDLILKRDSSSNVNQIRFQNGNGTVGTIKTSGTSTSFNTSSDYRLKENLTSLSGAIDRLNQLKPSRFNFISDPETTLDGFLAHEVSDIVPEAVSGEKDAVDENGDIDAQGIDQSRLVPLLVASVQELSAKVTALENA